MANNRTHHLNMATLGEDYPNQQARVRRIQGYAKSLGPIGSFMVESLENLLQRADRAVVEGDLVAMIRLYQEMKEVSE